MFDKHRLGKLAELRVQQELINLGYNPSEPSMEDRYDFLVEIDDSIKKIQVKKAYIREEYPQSLVVELRTTKRDKDGGNEKKIYSSDEVDVYAIWSNETDDVYWMEYDEAGSRCVHISLKEKYEVRGQNRSRMNFAMDFLIQNRLESNREPILDRDTEEEPEYEPATSW